jgi:hypothetical protein
MNSKPNNIYIFFIDFPLLNLLNASSKVPSNLQNANLAIGFIFNATLSEKNDDAGIALTPKSSHICLHNFQSYGSNNKLFLLLSFLDGSSPTTKNPPLDGNGLIPASRRPFSSVSLLAKYFDRCHS